MCFTTCLVLPKSSFVFSARPMSTSKPRAAACLMTRFVLLRALRAVSAFSCHSGPMQSRRSRGVSSSTGTDPSFGRTCSANGVNQRPFLPSPFSSDLRASKASCARCSNVLADCSASRFSLLRSLMGSMPAASCDLAVSARSRAYFKLTRGNPPSPISQRLPYRSKRRNH